MKNLFVDKNLFQRIWAGIGGFSRRVADEVARLTTWQFIFLCLLALIGAGILEGILDSGSERRHIRPVSVTVHKEASKTADKAAGSDSPAAKQPAEAAPKDSVKEQILTEIRKEIDSESDAADPAAANANKSKKVVEVRINGLTPDGLGERPHRSLPCRRSCSS